MYVYDCHAILTSATKNRSDKEMIRSFTSLTEDLKSLGINPGFHFMDNEASNALNLTMTTMNTKYQLVPPIKNRASLLFVSFFWAGLHDPVACSLLGGGVPIPEQRLQDR